MADPRYEPAGTVHEGWLEGPRSAVIALLRVQGYTVIEPTNPSPPAVRRLTATDTRPSEILGDNGEILGTFNPNQF